MRRPARARRSRRLRATLAAALVFFINAKAHIVIIKALVHLFAGLWVQAPSSKLNSFSEHLQYFKANTVCIPLYALLFTHVMMHFCLCVQTPCARAAFEKKQAFVESDAEAVLRQAKAASLAAALVPKSMKQTTTE